MSGFTPSSVNGILSSGMTSPTVPFCPQRLQNLSPIAGTRSSRIRTLAKRNPDSSSVINVLSTCPNCPFLGYTEESTTLSGSSILLVTLPITTVLSFISVFSAINPYLSSRL